MKEKIWTKIAWLLPTVLARWCFVRVAVHATQGKYGDTEVPALTCLDALRRWEG